MIDFETAAPLTFIVPYDGLAVNPELLLLDEPFSSLDTFTAEGLKG